jgi:hypothetical protein
MASKMGNRILALGVFDTCAFNLGFFNVDDINFHTYLLNPLLRSIPKGFDHKNKSTPLSQG